MNDIDFMWRGGYTKRYHTQRTLMEDTVGHHSYNVACIIMHLRPDASAALLKAALLHDVAEHVVGDMPAPTKRAMPAYPAGTLWPSGLTFREVFGRVEEERMAEAGVGYPALTDEEAWVLKLADAMDGMRFCVQERAMGNRHIGEVYENFRSYVSVLLFSAGCGPSAPVEGHPFARPQDLALYKELLEEYSLCLPLTTAKWAGTTTPG